MIIWLASYPKSGNTTIRSLLSAYFFSEDGTFDFNLIKNIKQFPHNPLFKEFGIETKNSKEMIKNYIKVQKLINKKNSIQFLKTHSSLFNINNSHFTNLDCSLGAIYIVRDPRNVVSSFARHFSLSIKEGSNRMINSHIMGSGLDEDPFIYIGSWSFHFNSWKSFKSQKKYLLIKYEDLINNRELTFLKVLKFLHKVKNVKFELDKSKFDNVIKTTTFDRLQKLEKQKGFSEAGIDVRTGERVPFFNLGPKNDWRKYLDLSIKQKLEKAFKKEMIELSYM